MNIPIELLRSFVSIQETGSFTRSAEQLRLTQPAISAQIKRLQQLVGGEVFAKSAFGVSLTEKGEIVSRYARRILAMNDQILSLSGSGSVSKSLRIGIPNVFADSMLSNVIVACRGGSDGERTQFSCEPSQDLARSLASGYLDLAFIVSPRNPPAQPIYRWSEQLCWSCARDFLLSPGASIPLLSWPHGISDQAAIEALENAGLQYLIVFVASDLAGHLAALRSRMGYFVLPERVVPADLKIAREHYLPSLPTCEAGIYIREGLETSKPVLAIADVMADIIGPRTGNPSMRPREKV
ncbi:LysR family transcriptional regulator [Pseudorhodoplanes sinuspersici]|nr:LysR family transcriptional regulator [Pseudorhodoplanes sinuspersici]